MHASVALGARVAALLDPDEQVAGVTNGTIQPAPLPIVPWTMPRRPDACRMHGEPPSTLL